MKRKVELCPGLTDTHPVVLSATAHWISTRTQATSAHTVGGMSLVNSKMTTYGSSPTTEAMRIPQTDESLGLSDIWGYCRKRILEGTGLHTVVVQMSVGHVGPR